MTNAIAGRCSRAMTVGLSTLTLTLTLTATLLVSSAPAMATDINVVAVDLPDGSLCTLPEAVAALNAGSTGGECGDVSGVDRLLLEEGASYLLGNQLVLRKPVTISSVNGRAVIDGGVAVPLIRIEASAAGTVLSNLRLTGGYAGTDLSNATVGGGIQAKGSVRIDNVIMDNNQADIGGAIYVDPVTNVGDIVVTVINSHITENIGLLDGGGIESGATLIVEATTVSGNSSGRAAGGILNTGSLTVRRSTISGNMAAGDVEPPSLGAGIYNRGSISVEQSTIAFNDPDGFLSDPGMDDFVEFKSSLLANNGVRDCSSLGNITSRGYNLVQVAGDCADDFSQDTDLLGQDPRLQPLAATDSGGECQHSCRMRFQTVACS